MNIKGITNNIFWNTLCPLLFEKQISKNSKITLFEKTEILKDAKIKEIFNSFFKNLFNMLNIEEDESVLCETGNETDPVKIGNKKYKKNPTSALFINLFKAFASLQHDLLLAKLNVYGFSYKLIKLIASFLSGRRYRTKINYAYSDREDLFVCRRNQC